MKRIKIITSALLAVLLMACGACSSVGKETELAHYDTLDGLYDNRIMSRNDLKLDNGDPGALWVSESQDAEYGGYCYVAITTLNNKFNMKIDGVEKAGMEMYRSKDLHTWESCGALYGSSLSITSEDWIDTWCWAPELYRDDKTGMYFMYFSASAASNNPNVSPSTAYQYDRMYLGIAMSSTPVGPYTVVTSEDYYSLLAKKDAFGNNVVQDGYLISKNGERITTVNSKGQIENLNGDVITKMMPPVNFGTETAKKYVKGLNSDNVFPCIDADFFKDERTGKMYLYFDSHLSSYKSSYGNEYNKNEIWVMEMKDMITPDYSTLQLVSTPSYKTVSAKEEYVTEGGETYRTVDVRPNTYNKQQPFFEVGDGNTVNEGAFMIQHGDKYYLTYSPCGTGNTLYSVCQAVSDSPLGPFTKLTDYNPVIGANETNDYLTGTGHHSFVKMGDEIFCVYLCFWGENTSAYGRCLGCDRVQFMYNEKLGYDILYGNGPTLSVQPAPEIYTGLKNIAKTAKITVNNGNKNTIRYLTDGLIPVQSWTLDKEFVSGGKVTVTLEWNTVQQISALFIYNSADYYTAFDKIDVIKFSGPDGKYVINNLKCNDENVNKNDLYMRQGGGAVASFNPLRVKKIEFTVSSKYTKEFADGTAGVNNQINISELYFAGKEI